MAAVTELEEQTKKGAQIGGLLTDLKGPNPAIMLGGMVVRLYKFVYCMNNCHSIKVRVVPPGCKCLEGLVCWRKHDNTL